MKYFFGGLLYVLCMGFVASQLFPDINAHYPEKDMMLTLLAMPGVFIFMDLMSKSQEGGN